MGMPYCVPYFDGACNTLARFRPLRRSGAQVDLQRLRKFSPAAQVFALWGDSRLARPALFRVLMHRTERELAMNADIARLCRSAADARTAAEEDRVAVFLSVEGAEMLGCSVADLAEAYRRGIRSVAPVWDFDNALCGAARDGGGGLTEAGERFVRAAGELGMAIDLSHSSERAFWDVIRLGGGGVWCSNSDARSVCDHPRVWLCTLTLVNG